MEETFMGPHTSYIICATQRSGSTLLCEALKNTNIAGYPEEYFDALEHTGVPRRPLEYVQELKDQALLDIFAGRDQPDEEQRQPPPGMSYAAYLDWAIQKSTSPNGVFGTKLMWGYFPDFISKLLAIPQYRDMKDVPIPELLATIFPNLHYIYVTRRDKVGQAISLWRALQTWTWRREDATQTSDDTKHAHELIFHYGAIDHLVMLIAQYEAGWQQFFAAHQIQALTVVYEDLIVNYEEIARAVLHYLDIAVPQDLALVPPRMQRQSDNISARWAEQYYELKKQV
jgi:trehalose 2-sulfotransferase